MLKKAILDFRVLASPWLLGKYDVFMPGMEETLTESVCVKNTSSLNTLLEAAEE
jgi:hypothetical protein